MKELFIFSLLSCALALESVKHGAPIKDFAHAHESGGHNHLDHQAVLGSRKSASEFDNLPVEESIKRLRVIAQRMDLDKDGFVTEEELQKWVYNSLISLDLEETKERFEELDQNHDGKITWDEYIHEAFGTETGKDLDAEETKLLAEDQIYFKAADVDGDGSLSEKEFEAFQNPEHHSHMHQALIRNTLATKDENKDNKIDLKEFLGDIADQPTSEFYLTEKSRFTDEYDKNKDGKLDKEELVSWLIPNLNVVAREEAVHLIESADKDHDGKLSIDEIAADYATFVGSEATTFGEQLNDVKHDEL